jgi:hypothetical protein
MRKYLPIGLALAIFASTPALARTIHHSAKPSTQSLYMSAIAPAQGATIRTGISGKLQNSDAPAQDCVQHSFGINIALPC